MDNTLCLKYIYYEQPEPPDNKGFIDCCKFSDTLLWIYFIYLKLLLRNLLESLMYPQ